MTSIREIFAKVARPMQSKSAAYTFVLGDRNETFLHPAADTTARTWTIPANASVAYATGTTLRIVNEIAAGIITLAITTDTMTCLNPYQTGSLLIYPGDVVEVTKVSSTAWVAEYVARTPTILSKSAAYTFVITDAFKTYLHPAADTTARIWTIPANASVAFQVGTEIYLENETLGGVITVTITSDTLLLMPTGTTADVAIAASGYAVLKKLTATKWGIRGGGLT